MKQLNNEASVRKIIEGLLKSLINSELQRFPKLRKGLNIPEKQGVYIIYNSKGKLVHVGRTQRGKKGLQQRLRNHLRGLSSFTRKYLRGKGNKLRIGYKFKYKVIKNPRERALVEALAVGRLCPKHLGL